ncbi:MAG: sodium:proton antiporter [Clostridiales bacterium]|jgi:NhaC family Na+:H+ antiporter|nr:sodium:proton antiporter [Clostridiales bacterium]
MLEIGILGIFALALLACVWFDLSILYALLFGFIMFFAYGIYKNHSAMQMWKMAFSGIRTVRNILITFILIGIITAIWRAGGTIPFIVYHATKVCSPSAMVLITFLLCCLVSVLTGTSFGTAATVGVICMTMANSMGIPPLFTGGAILSGAYFGDRCSPMSTSALLVSNLTNTNIFRNIVNMIKTSLVPFAVSCAFYLALGMLYQAEMGSTDVQEIFAECFDLHPSTLVPAVVIILFSLFKINVKITMSVSIVFGALLSLFIQGIQPSKLLEIAITGYYPENRALASVLSGGGIISMTRVFAIVCLSSCYAGMFNGTGFLEGVKKILCTISAKVTPFGGILITSLLTGMIACNQTLTIMLTHQICNDVEKEPETMAVHLENTAVVVAPLIPWSIAGSVPLGTVGAPTVCILTACYIYLLPLWNLACAVLHSKHPQPSIANGP